MPIIIKNKSELLRQLNSYRSKKINFIPTMGNLHDGHISLIKKAKKSKYLNLVSIYVNPLQFNDKHDLKKYPRTIKEDIVKLKKIGVDIVFIPHGIFNDTNSFTINVGDISKKLCGAKRSGHFEGVATIILKLLLLIRPNKIFLGEKDFQQILIIKKLIKDFNFDIKVVSVKTQRDKNGVALSSRNQFVQNSQLLEEIYKNLQFIKGKILSGNFNLFQLNTIKDNLIDSGIDEVNYLELLKESNLSPLDSKPTTCRLFISVRIGNVNLIDNLKLAKRLSVCENGIVNV
jgi:pantoate--beta-alanine ligase